MKSLASLTVVVLSLVILTSCGSEPDVERSDPSDWGVVADGSTAGGEPDLGVAQARVRELDSPSTSTADDATGSFDLVDPTMTGLGGADLETGSATTGASTATSARPGVTPPPALRESAPGSASRSAASGSRSPAASGSSSTREDQEVRRNAGSTGSSSSGSSESRRQSEPRESSPPTTTRPLPLEPLPLPSSAPGTSTAGESRDSEPNDGASESRRDDDRPNATSTSDPNGSAADTAEDRASDEDSDSAGL